ncbi:MAG TPA: S41 family peptidase [Kofleriaceae bacterium]|nr:S41 family peptidase [Kofleriaceae bacterium]
MTLRRCLLLPLLAACGDDGSLPSVDLLAAATPLHANLYRLDTQLEMLDDRVRGSCGDGGAERIYRFVAPSTGIAHVTLRGARPTLYARRAAADAATELACSDTLGPLTGAAEIDFSITAGETYFVVAERSNAPDETPWRLELELVPPFADLDALAGKYRSRGYGYILGFDDEQFVLREASDLHCMNVLGGPIAGLSSVIDEIAPGPEADTIVVTPASSAGTITFERLTATPPHCKGDGTPAIGDAGYVRDALATYELFARAFADHYAFFTERGVDANALLASGRAGLTPSSTDDELFAAMVRVAEPLHDGHVSVTSLDDAFESKPQELATLFASEPGAADDAEAYVEAQLARAKAISVAAASQVMRSEYPIVAGRLANDIGYVRLDHFAITRAHQPLYLAALDRALAALANTRGLVVDLRFNGGGADRVAIEAASRFARNARVFARKHARTESSRTPPIDLAVAPATTAYPAPIVVLAGGSTASAAETFVLALRGQPTTRIAGWRTSGELSDILSRTLPNGWSFGLSNEIYLDADGKLFEVQGIPPDVAFTTLPFPIADRIDGVDRAVASAAELLP